MRRNHIDLQNPMHTIGGVVLGCIFIGLCIYGFYQMKSSFSSGMNQYNSVTMEYAELDKSLYDGMMVSGGEVIKAINKLIEDEAVSVRVTTLSNKENEAVGSGVDASDKSQVYKKNNGYKEDSKSSPNYINENASFEGKVTRNENGIISMVTFTQQKN